MHNKQHEILQREQNSISPQKITTRTYLWHHHAQLCRDRSSVGKIVHIPEDSDRQAISQYSQVVHAGKVNGTASQTVELEIFLEIYASHHSQTLCRILLPINFGLGLPALYQQSDEVKYHQTGKYTAKCSIQCVVTTSSANQSPVETSKGGNSR